jgi:Holliday junction resolvasome RuvABC endonuclease subunit
MSSKKSKRVLLFDPGWNSTGWAVLDVTINSPKIEVHRFGQISPSGEAHKVDKRVEVGMYGVRAVTMSILSSAINGLIEEFKPDYIASEDAFFSRFPTAHRALVEWLTVLVIQAQNHQHRVYLMAPKSIKMATTGSGDADKGNIQQSILNNGDIKFKQKQKVTQLQEHEADAIGVGVAFIKLLLPGLLAKEEEAPTSTVSKTKQRPPKEGK